MFDNVLKFDKDVIVDKMLVFSNGLMFDKGSRISMLMFDKGIILFNI